MIQQSHSWGYTKGMKHSLLQRHLHTHVYCSTIHNSQVIITTKMPHYWWMDPRKCGIYTQWNFIQPQRRRKSYHLQVNGWNWRTSLWERSARLRRPKIVCSHSYVNFRSRENTAMWLDLGSHDKGRAHMGDMGIGRKPKIWKYLMSDSRGINKESLKQWRLTWEGDQEPL
jgi:hypothetical protein